MSIFKELYNYRELLKTNVKKEIRGKYKGSFLGVMWSFLNPLLMVLVYSLVFPFILKISEANYVVFLICGIIPWNFFTTVLTYGVTTIVGNGNILKKVYFPREILPISVVSSGLVNFLISCIIIFAFLIFYRIGFSVYILFLPLIIAIQYMLSLGLVFLISAIDVYIRDLEYIINVILMLLFYLTPVLYSSTNLPEHLRWVFKINPMAYIIESYKSVLYYKQLPDVWGLVIVAIISSLVLLIGYAVFKKLEKGFAEEL